MNLYLLKIPDIIETSIFEKLLVHVSFERKKKLKD